MARDLFDAIRLRAYEIWESEGCPQGRIHWLRAEAEQRDGRSPKTSSEPRKTDLHDAPKVKPGRKRHTSGKGAL